MHAYLSDIQLEFGSITRERHLPWCQMHPIVRARSQEDNPVDKTQPSSEVCAVMSAMSSTNLAR